MESKSHDSDELVAALVNSVETLSKKFDKMDDRLRKNTEVAQKTNVAIQELEVTVTKTNKIFEQVATGVKDLYEKVKTLEILSKVMGNLGNLGPLLGGLGNPPKK